MLPHFSPHPNLILHIKSGVTWQWTNHLATSVAMLQYAAVSVSMRYVVLALIRREADVRYSLMKSVRYLTTLPIANSKPVQRRWRMNDEDVTD